MCAQVRKLNIADSGLLLKCPLQRFLPIYSDGRARMQIDHFMYFGSTWTLSSKVLIAASASIYSITGMAEPSLGYVLYATT